MQASIQTSPLKPGWLSNHPGPPGSHKISYYTIFAGCLVGVVGAASSWLLSYLRDHLQFVCLGGHSSALTHCDCGVPQGSVLGPLLFSAYASPLASWSSHGVMRVLPPVRWRHAWTALTLHRPLTDSHTAPLQFACGSCRTACSSTQVVGCLPRHHCSAPVSCQHHYCRHCRKHSAGRTAAQDAWRDHRLPTCGSTATLAFSPMMLPRQSCVASSLWG